MTNEDIVKELSMITARLDRLAAKLADPTKRLPPELEGEPSMLTHQIRDAVKQSGKTQKAIAEAAGIGEVALGRFLSGKKDLNGATLNKLVTALGLELTERKRGKK